MPIITHRENCDNCGCGRTCDVWNMLATRAVFTRCRWWVPVGAMAVRNEEVVVRMSAWDHMNRARAGRYGYLLVKNEVKLDRRLLNFVVYEVPFWELAESEGCLRVYHETRV